MTPLHRSQQTTMNEASPARICSSSIIVDPAPGAFPRRYFVVAAEDSGAHRAFTARGASRIATRPPTTPWWSTLKRKWDLQVEKEEIYRQRVGWQ